MQTSCASRQTSSFVFMCFLSYDIHAYINEFQFEILSTLPKHDIFFVVFDTAHDKI